MSNETLASGKLRGWQSVSEKAALKHSHYSQGCEDVGSTGTPGDLSLHPGAILVTGQPGRGLFVPLMRTAKGWKWKFCLASQREATPATVAVSTRGAAAPGHWAPDRKSGCVTLGI